MPRAVPTADAKIGRKIDFIVAELGDVLAAHGFVRKARCLWREFGTGELRGFFMRDFQGDKWTEGNQGKFLLNIGAQFPALNRLAGEMSGTLASSTRQDCANRARAKKPAIIKAIDAARGAAKGPAGPTA